MELNTRRLNLIKIALFALAFGAMIIIDYFLHTYTVEPNHEPPDCWDVCEGKSIRFRCNGPESEENQTCTYICIGSLETECAD